MWKLIIIFACSGVTCSKRFQIIVRMTDDDDDDPVRPIGRIIIPSPKTATAVHGKYGHLGYQYIATLSSKQKKRSQYRRTHARTEGISMALRDDIYLLKTFPVSGNSLV